MRYLILLCCASCSWTWDCTDQDGAWAGTGACIMEDNGQIPTEVWEIEQAVKVFTDVSGYSIPSDQTIQIYVRPEMISCPRFSDVGCYGIYFPQSGVLEFVREAEDVCLSSTAFMHEWAHVLLAYLRPTFGHEDIEFFGADGLLFRAMSKYYLDYCAGDE